jgi:pimeloyl-ACP methyl ester carboxylesterase
MVTFGLSVAFGAVMGILVVEGFLITTLDTAVRLNRYLLQELWNTIFANPPKLVKSLWFNSALAVGLMLILAVKDSYKAIWPLFGSTNQLLAALALIWGEGRIASFSGEALLSEFIEHQSEYASERYAAALARKPLLLVAGAEDEVTPPALHHAPLVAAIRAEGGGLLRETTLAGDHSFSASRIALTRVVLEWLDGDCLQTRSGS